MEIRTAYEQGLLSQRSLNHFQYWALQYHMALVRKLDWDTRNEMVKQAAWVFQPKRYMEVYAKPVQDLVQEMEEAPVDPSEFDDIESWLQHADKKRVGSFQTQDDDEGWI